MKKPVKFLRLPVVAERLGISRSQVWKLSQRGELPRPVKLTAYTTAWVESEVDSYMRKLIRQRDLKRGAASPSAALRKT